MPASVANPHLVTALLSADAPAIAAAVREALVLLAATAGTGGAPAQIRTGTGSGGHPLIWAFTDLEALAAWDRDPPDAAVVVRLRDLLEASSAQAPAAVLNPAGPGATLIAGPIGADGARRESPSHHELADPARRRPVRRRARRSHDRGRQAAAAGDLTAAIGAWEEALDACGELGDRLHGAACGRELAICHARAGNLAHARALWAATAQTFAGIGETVLAGATRDEARGFDGAPGPPREGGDGD